MKQHAPARCACVVEDFDGRSVRQAKHVPGMMRLRGIEWIVAQSKQRDMNSSGHAGDYRSAIMGWQQFMGLMQAAINVGRQASDKGEVFGVGGP